RLLDRHLRPRQLVEAPAAAVGMGEDRLDAAAVLALETVERGQALLHLLEAPGRGLDRVLIAPQLAAEVVGLVTEPPQPLREPVEPRVDARDRLQPRRRLRPQGGGR